MVDKYLCAEMYRERLNEVDLKQKIKLMSYMCLGHLLSSSQVSGKRLNWLAPDSLLGRCNLAVFGKGVSLPVYASMCEYNSTVGVFRCKSAEGRQRFFVPSILREFGSNMLQKTFVCLLGKNQVS